MGHYQKTITVLINDNEIPPQEKIFHPYNRKKRGDNLNEIWPNCEYYLEMGFVNIVSEKVDVNPDYDPEFWQQEYDAQAEAIAMAEKKGYHIF